MTRSAVAQIMEAKLKRKEIVWSLLYIFSVFSKEVICTEVIFDTTTVLSTTTVEESYSTLAPLVEIQYENETANTSDTFKYEIDNENYISHNWPSVFDLNNYENACENKDLEDFEFICKDSALTNFRECANDFNDTICSDFQCLINCIKDFPCYLSDWDAEFARNCTKTYSNKWREMLNTSAETGQELREEYQTGILKAEMLQVAVNKTYEAEASYMKLIENIFAFNSLRKYAGDMNRTIALIQLRENRNKSIIMLETHIPLVENLIEYYRKHDIVNIFNTTSFYPHINVPYFRKTIQYYKLMVLQYEKEIEYTTTIDIIRLQVRFSIFLIVFLIGIVSNILLIIVFIKHSDMRTIANIMLMNLTFVDCISLTINLPLVYIKTNFLWPLGVEGCQAFFFLRYLIIFVSTYSVVMISLQRFLAVTSFPKAGGCTLSNKAKSLIMISGVWGISIIYSSPRLFYSNLKKGMCVFENDDAETILHVTDFTFICVLPSVLLAVFSGLTVNRIKRSVLSAVGERTGQEQLRKDRMLSAHVLTGLAILFVISYFPTFLFYVIKFLTEPKLDDMEVVVIDLVTYTLMFANSCLNPIALCVMSKKYRKYILELLPCCAYPLKQVDTKFSKGPTSSSTSVSTTATSVSTTESTI